MSVYGRDVFSFTVDKPVIISSAPIYFSLFWTDRITPSLSPDTKKSSNSAARKTFNSLSSKSFGDNDRSKSMVMLPLQAPFSSQKRTVPLVDQVKKSEPRGFGCFSIVTPNTALWWASRRVDLVGVGGAWSPLSTSLNSMTWSESTVTTRPSTMPMAKMLGFVSGDMLDRGVEDFEEQDDSDAAVNRACIDIACSLPFFPAIQTDLLSFSTVTQDTLKSTCATLSSRWVRSTSSSTSKHTSPRSVHNIALPSDIATKQVKTASIRGPSIQFLPKKILGPGLAGILSPRLSLSKRVFKGDAEETGSSLHTLTWRVPKLIRFLLPTQAMFWAFWHLLLACSFPEPVFSLIDHKYRNPSCKSPREHSQRESGEKETERTPKLWSVRIDKGISNGVSVVEEKMSIRGFFPLFNCELEIDWARIWL